MKKQEALEDFKKNCVRKKSIKKLLELDTYYENHKEELADSFMKAFKEICIKIKEMQTKKEKGKIGYISYSMLRSEILEKNYTYLIEAFDEKWFFDYKECHGNYYTNWAFKFLDNLEEELQEARKIYAGYITALDIEKIKLQEGEKYNEYIVKLARYALFNRNLDVFKEIEKEEEVEISVGEYRDLSEIVYIEDTREKDSQEIKEWLEENLEDEYIHKVFKNLDLSKGDYEGLDFTHSNFAKSNLEESNMKNCTLVGSIFNECNLQKVDFRNAYMEETSFKGADLKDAVFLKSDLKILNLDEEQVLDIIWED